jgi:hypothetical protein
VGSPFPEAAVKRAGSIGSQRSLTDKAGLEEYRYCARFAPRPQFPHRHCHMLLHRSPGDFENGADLGCRLPGGSQRARIFRSRWFSRRPWNDMNSTPSPGQQVAWGCNSVFDLHHAGGKIHRACRDRFRSMLRIMPASQAARDRSWEAVMQYFFVIRNGPTEGNDEDGTPLHDDDEARNYALRIIRELKEGGGYDDAGWRMIVFAEGGRQVCRMPFSAATIPSRTRRTS